MVQNLGTIFLVVFVSIILISILPVLKLVAVVFKAEKAERLFVKIRNMFFWNGLLIFFLEGYFELCINSMINLQLYFDYRPTFSDLFFN